MKEKYIKFALLLLFISICTFSIAQTQPKNLSNTSALLDTGDLSSKMAQGINNYLDKETSKSVNNRAKHWNRDFSNSEAYDKSILPKRKQLSQIIGIYNKLNIQDQTRIKYFNGGHEIHAVSN